MLTRFGQLDTSSGHLEEEMSCDELLASYGLVGKLVGQFLDLCFI